LSTVKLQIYNLGDHRLACGDCRDLSLVRKLIGGSRVNLVITDPPYGVSYVEGKSHFGHIKKDVPILNDNFTDEKSYSQFTTDWLNTMKGFLDVKNACYIFNSDRMIFSLREGMNDSGFRLAQLLIWVKSNQVIGRRDYLAAHELIAYGWYGAHSFYKLSIISSRSSTYSGGIGLTLLYVNVYSPISAFACLLPILIVP